MIEPNVTCKSSSHYFAMRDLSLLHNKESCLPFVVQVNDDADTFWDSFTPGLRICESLPLVFSSYLQF